ncbi:predicted protein [Histoplasma mississippiense (nom. inval.)]|uniref:predicted protein n=1 Tax=Ajellomyces capsulatus (strain NAm1 / WU24) TaxID=2059318 RepID=UPI000157BD2A|nr:predicted protein [Histoplasma mississippiense (nom. inval.)]EDN05925.1 predicted protein [Histoplasma mississippiense (nom. inval.)]
MIFMFFYKYCLYDELIQKVPLPLRCYYLYGVAHSLMGGSEMRLARLPVSAATEITFRGLILSQAALIPYFESEV